jgi:hypothetical protein
MLRCNSRVQNNSRGNIEWFSFFRVFKRLSKRLLGLLHAKRQNNSKGDRF